MPGAGWINADGTPLLVALLSTAQTEPDDADMNEADHAEQVGAFTAMGVFDLPGRTAQPVICECDGKAVSPAFQALVQATPFN